VLFTITNLTAGQLEAGPFGLLQAGVTKSVALPAAVFETLAPMLTSQVSKGYITLTVAVDPNTSVLEQVGDFQQTVQPNTTFSEVAFGTPTTINGPANRYQYTATAGGYKGLLAITGVFGATAGATSYIQVLSDASAVPTIQRAFIQQPAGGSTGGATFYDQLMVPIEPNANVIVNTFYAAISSATIYKITQ
jgi:hypothetical protein